MQTFKVSEISLKSFYNLKSPQSFIFDFFFLKTLQKNSRNFLRLLVLVGKASTVNNLHISTDYIIRYIQTIYTISRKKYF